RNGVLWGQMPVRGLWLWALLVGSRLIMTVIALAVGAKVAGSSAPIVMLLGINRLGQAAIVMRHALGTGIPFAPEKDGTSFLSGQIGGAASRSPGRACQHPPQRGPSYPEPDWPPAPGPGGYSGQRQAGHRPSSWPPTGRRHAARRRAGPGPGDAGPPGS
ncbi:MAG: hypothetical protein JWL68_5455, partial [Actinomycetia bacterium]|nr:hypothetical protein [Actinomycetes bacterium]